MEAVLTHVQMAERLFLTEVDGHVIVQMDLQLIVLDDDREQMHHDEMHHDQLRRDVLV